MYEYLIYLESSSSLSSSSSSPSSSSYDIIIISYSLQAVNSVVAPDRGDAGMSPRADERSQTEEEHNDDEHPPG